MKNKLAIIPLVVLVLISACDKKSKLQYSNWTINGESFSTNDVEVAIGKARSGLASKDLKNRFSLGFDIGFELPKSGSFTITTTGGDPNQYAGLTFYYKGKFYIKSEYSAAILIATESKKKAQYELPATWYAGYDNPTSDSVLISGVFKQP